MTKNFRGFVQFSHGNLSPILPDPSHNVAYLKI
jgi:hypothetical protein